MYLTKDGAVQANALPLPPLDKKNYVFSEYTSDGVKFIAGKDAHGYWLFFAA